MTAGNTGAIGVGFLMTTRAIQTRHAFAFRAATHDVGDMTPSLISLLRIISGGVTVDAARMGQHGIDLFPRSEALRRAGVRVFRTSKTSSAGR